MLIIDMKRDDIMKIAISTDNGYVSSHFGRCPEFTFVEIEDNKKISGQTIMNPGHETGYLPQFLKDNGINCIIAGGMGMRAKELFKEANIETILGVEGKIEDITEKILDETIKGKDNTCEPGLGKGYGVEKKECDHE